jgi:hypothetical protein
MGSGPTIVRLARGASSAVDVDTEAGRAFLQERLAFYNRVAFIISGSFFVVGAVLFASGVASPGEVAGAQSRRASLLHAATLAVQLATWVACSRGRRLPVAALRAIDVGVLVLVCLGFAVQSVSVASPHFEQMGPFPRATMMLILTNMLIARAVFVPSPAAWTATVSAAAAVPVVAAAGLAPSPPGIAAPVGAVALWAALWAACAAVAATLASRLIYGLRREVREARRLGQYTLEEKLGEGGMGAVYRASHAMLRRPTAIKLLPPEKAGQAALERFEREVQLTARLSHPNTVAVFDYGRTPDGVFYYAMEYLEGLNLEVLVREDGPQPAARVAHVLRQVASALVEAHGIGLVHRDVKPENILLCERGGVPDVAKVVDFGLVKDLERGGAALSRADLVQGTPLYLSPEAITAPDRVDARGDLYALGAVGYYMLTGKHVFSGATLVEVCSHHLHTAPEPPSARLGQPVPPALEAILLRCLEKDPACRPASAVLLRDALAAAPGVGEWTENDARGWWTRWRARPTSPEKTT